ncbi:glycosyltransferase family 9 protein [Candidatus Poribacteria bacterium]|nr:glycosyltransferase family 9 protein [Candidatus Poribacteria bacterium]
MMIHFFIPYVKHRAFDVAFIVLRLLVFPLRKLEGLIRSGNPTDGILILALCRGIGDFALFCAPYQALRASQPPASITVAVYPQNIEIVSLLLRDAQIVLFQGWRALYAALRKKRYRCVIDIAAEASWKPTLFSFLISSEKRMGLYSNLRGILYDYAVRYATNRSVQDLLFNLLRPLGVQGGNQVSLKASELGPMPNGLRNLLASHAGSSLVAIHPGARDDIDKADKRWPVEHFGRLAAMLGKAVGARVIILGSPSERELGERVLRASGGQAQNLAGKTSLVELIHLLSRCDILVCNNSGLLHLAVLLGVSTVSFVGPVVIERWGPGGDQMKHFVVPNEWGECPGDRLTGRERAVAQLRSIPPEKVLPVVLERLQRQKV